MLEARNIALGYHGKILVSDISFTLSQGEICAVIGHNGAGKSTLIRTLLGFQNPLSGHLIWQGGRSVEATYLGQLANFDSQFPMRVKDVVAMGTWQELGFWASIDRQKSERIDYALSRTGLKDMANRPLYECSSGQLQRCFFARAIVQDTRLILLDEPFSAIDQTTETKLVEIIKEWKNEGRALMIVLHDLSAVMGISDKCLLLGGGQASYGTTKDMINTQALLSHKYLSPTQAHWLATLQGQKQQKEQTAQDQKGGHDV